MARSTSIPKGLKKDWQKLAEAMKAKGYKFEPGSRHIKAFPPDGITPAQTLPSSPSDVRAWRNERAKFRRWCSVNGIEPGI